MGFLTAWDDNERVDVSDLAGDLPGTWWIDVKKCLSHGESDEIMRGLIQESMDFKNTDSDGRPKVRISGGVVMNQQANIVARSIVAWNLTDQNDDILPFVKDDSLTNPYEPIERSLASLPSPVYDRVAKVVVDANTETKAETASFPAESDGSGESGENYRPNDREILV